MFSFFRRKKKQPEAEVKPVEEAAKQPEAKAPSEAPKPDVAPVPAATPKPVAATPPVPIAPLPAAKKPQTGSEEYDELPTFTLLPFGDSGLVFDDEEELSEKEKKAKQEKKPAKDAAPKKVAKKAETEGASKKKGGAKAKTETKKPIDAKKEGKKTQKPEAAEEKKVEEVNEKQAEPKPSKEITETQSGQSRHSRESRNPETTGETEPDALDSRLRGNDVEDDAKVDAPSEKAELVKEEKVLENADPKTESKPESKKGWFSRLKDGLSKSSRQLSDGLSALVTKRKLDDDTVEQLEELLITADMGASTATAIAANIAKNRYDKEISEDELREALAEEVTDILTPVAEPLTFKAKAKPHILLMVGVNGNGKTTTIGKLSQQFKQAGQSVMLCAADTFRAAAVEQLQVWGKRNDVPVITGELEADAASVAYRALEQAKEAKSDWLLIDTAGRLQNKANLMAELEKIIRVLKKIDPDAPHSVVQVLDATTGQNAISQVETFQKLVGVNGLIVTKLDGSARAGVVVALAQKFKLPIHALGVGEQIDDLKPFNAKDFARSLVSLA